MLYFIKNIKKLRQFIILLLLCCFCMAVIAVITAESMARLTEFFTISGVKGAGKIMGIDYYVVIWKPTYIGIFNRNRFIS